MKFASIYDILYNLLKKYIEGKYAIISKSKTPAINFVVHHPLLLDAIEYFHI